MITQHNLAGNIVYSLHDENANRSFCERLLTNCHRVYNKYMNIYARDNFSYFRTPYSMDPKTAGPGYQFEPEDRKIELDFEKYCKESLDSLLSKDFELQDMWYLYQPNESWIDNPPHEHLTAHWVAVMYLELTPGDSIIFYDSENNSEAYEPNIGEVIFFEGNAFHKPGPSIGNRRISVNAEFTERFII